MIYIYIYIDVQRLYIWHTRKVADGRCSSVVRTWLHSNRTGQVWWCMMFIAKPIVRHGDWLKMGSLGCGKSVVMSAWIRAGSWACTNLGTVQSVFNSWNEWQAGEMSNEVKVITPTWSSLLMWLNLKYFRQEARAAHSLLAKTWRSPAIAQRCLGAGGLSLQQYCTKIA